MFAKGGRGWLKKKRRKRVLLAWEVGAGRTHYSNLLAVASYLKTSGIDCLATLGDASAADREFAAIGVRTVQNYVWPSHRSWNSNLGAIRNNSFTDYLAGLGFNSSAAVTAAIAHYDGLASLFEPDLVLCEHAYGGILAAREHLPVVAIGFCVRLPPIVNGGFPIFPGRIAPSVPVAELLASINRGLIAAGRFPLKEIGDLLRIAAVMPFGAPPFDFYADLRREPILPPSVPGLRDAYPTNDGDQVFVYLHAFVQEHPAVIDGLAALDMPVRAYLPNFSEETRLKLSNVVIDSQPVPVKEIFARARCVVHLGGEQLTSACLAAGVPQVILSQWMDNRVSGGFVKANQLGDSMPIGAATAEWITGTIRQCYEDQALKDRCNAAAPTYRKWFEVEPTAIVADRVCQLLGIESRHAQDTKSQKPPAYKGSIAP
jgi:hypothetical protein